jgi:hypothetical protein
MTLYRWTGVGMLLIALAIAMKPDAGVSGYWAGVMNIPPTTMSGAWTFAFIVSAAALFTPHLRRIQFGFCLMPMFLYTVGAFYVGLVGGGNLVPSVMYAMLALTLRALADREVLS